MGQVAQQFHSSAVKYYYFWKDRRAKLFERRKRIDKNRWKRFFLFLLKEMKSLRSTFNKS